MKLLIVLALLLTGCVSNADLNAIKSLVSNLQESLAETNRIAKDLQKAFNNLKVVSSSKSTTDSLGMDIDQMKALINSGISDTKSNFKPGRPIRK